MNSIRKRLLVSLLAGLIASTTVVGVIIYLGSVDELNELLTDNLKHMAAVLKGQAFPSLRTQGPLDADNGEPEESYVIQIWNSDGALVRSSWPSIDLPLETRDGLGSVEREQRRWRTYTLKVGAAGYVQIAQPQEIVATMVAESAMTALVPLLVLFALMGVGGWVAVGHSLSPLDLLSEKISRWDVNDLRPLNKAGVPNEVQPIVGALNMLLQRLEGAMAQQQQFTADSAHELRTPLAAIKLQLENIVRATCDEERDRAVTKLSAGIDRCTHLVGQLLTASRSMMTKMGPQLSEIYLNELVRTTLASFVPTASSRRIEIAFEADTECRLVGDEEGLRALINNLVDNAVRYSHDGGCITVRLVQRPEGEIVLDVGDDGPGIPADQHQKIFQRFYRIPGTVPSGSGLGLSIVQNVAVAHRAEVRVMSAPLLTGTTIRVAFPGTRLN